MKGNSHTQMMIYPHCMKKIITKMNFNIEALTSYQRIRTILSGNTMQLMEENHQIFQSALGIN